MTREEEGIRYAYIGQAVKVLTRLGQHLSGYQHIDLSIKKHGFYAAGTNEEGWKIRCEYCDEAELDEKEKAYIKEYANAGYQMRNKTIGGQGKGKKGMGEQKPPKGYRDGIEQGYKNAQKEIRHLFALHLDVVCKKDPPTTMQLKALEKFKDFIGENE